MNGEKINHPEHYKGNKYEAIDIIDDYQLGFNLGNAVKYILRAGKKGDTLALPATIGMAVLRLSQLL